MIAAGPNFLSATLRRWTTLCLVSLLTVLSGCSKPVPFNAAEVPKLTYGHGVALTDTDGKRRRIEEFRNQVTVVFFGFTRCPDACPTTLARLRQVRAALGPQASKMQVVLVSLDPERDTADVLRVYVKHFDPSFIGLRPDPADLERVQREFRVIAIRTPLGDGDYTVDHSSTIYVYDRQARLRLIAQPDLEISKLAADIARLATE